MFRYNKQVFFPKDNQGKLEAVNEALNQKDYIFTKHFFEQVKTRFSDINFLGQYLKALKLQAVNIFEYYIDGGQVVKVCYRLQYTREQDIILVFSKDKALISIFLNAVNDNHKTIDKKAFSTV